VAGGRGRHRYGDSTRTGVGVDYRGAPAVDPTANVIALNEAGLASLTSKLEAIERRQDDLRTQESVHIREIMALRAAHGLESRQQEAARIDAIRAVDVAAVRTQAEVSTQSAAALATALAATAEAMRVSRAQDNASLLAAISQAVDPLRTAVEDLRRAQYEQVGKTTQVADTRERGAGWGMWIGLGVAALGLLVGVAGAAVAIIVAMP